MEKKLKQNFFSEEENVGSDRNPTIQGFIIMHLLSSLITFFLPFSYLVDYT